MLPQTECQVSRKQATTNVDNDVEKNELLHTVDGNVN
jgi:hypothetical protein